MLCVPHFHAGVEVKTRSKEQKKTERIAFSLYLVLSKAVSQSPSIVGNIQYCSVLKCASKLLHIAGIAVDDDDDGMVL